MLIHHLCKELSCTASLVEHFDLVVDGDAKAFPQFLDSVRDFTGVAHSDKVVVDGRDEQHTRGHVAGASMVSALLVFVVEDLLDSEPAFLDLDGANHDAVSIEVFYC